MGGRAPACTSKGTDDLSSSNFSKATVAGGRLKWFMERMGGEK